MRGDEFFQQVSIRPPFTKLHPRVAEFFRRYLASEKALEFRGRHVINTQFPPYPSRAFDELARQFAEIGDASTRRLYSVTLAVTNRCQFRCWHCYNAGRSQQDMPLETLQVLARKLQDLGAIMITLTGGEPVLRADLPQIVRAFDTRSCLILGTTGEGLTDQLARELQAAGLFAVGISLDSADETEHDRLRGRQGAFRNALRALAVSRDAGLYPYVVSVATHDFLKPDRVQTFLRFVANAGALEVHLLEPCPTGRLAGQTGTLLSSSERQAILDLQKEAAGDATLPVVSSFAYLEAPGAFGCGAGLTHLYIDGSGEVCPCNLVPLSFGNICEKPLADILERMAKHFRQPRTACIGRMLSRHYPRETLPAPPDASEVLCGRVLPREHELPAFFRIRSETRGQAVGAPELRRAYDSIHDEYDEFWLSAAAAPVRQLIEKLSFKGSERVFEAGCGTGYATALLAGRCGEVLAVDISEGMQSKARERLGKLGLENVAFESGDALECLRGQSGLDMVFSSWVLGYIPLEPFFTAAARALKPGGVLAFVVHRDNSPAEPLEIFGSLVAEDPGALTRQVAFDFPVSPQVLIEQLSNEFVVREVREGVAVFRYGTADEVLQHLLGSGAGTAFYEALDPAKRPALTTRFLAELEARHGGDRGAGDFGVCHDWIACVAVRRIPVV